MHAIDIRMNIVALLGKLLPRPQARHPFTDVMCQMLCQLACNSAHVSRKNCVDCPLQYGREIPIECAGHTTLPESVRVVRRYV